MKIKFLKESALKRLKDKELINNIDYYKGNNLWLDKKYNNEELFVVFDKKEFPDFKLIESPDSKYDFENMKILYDSLKDLTDSQASDERVWAGLAHTYLWDYMQVRWPLPENKDKQKNHILNNYFFWNSSKAVYLNGISRLWWYARVTYDETLDDPYELTKYICKNDINGKFFPLLSCVFVNNNFVFRSIIKSIKRYEDDHNITISRKDFNAIKTYLSRLSGTIVIDILSEEEIYDKISHRLDFILTQD